MSAVLGAAELRRAALASLEALRARQAEIDRANVYPVPDGDTGTNLVLTMESVARALDAVPDDPAQVSHAVMAGSLMGARGNSGVILAQVLRGLCEAVDGRPATPDDVARGLRRAAELAYEAVLEPVEGTMLTVARAAADAAEGRADGDIAVLFEAAAAGARDALARTPDVLPILKEAGVVDAGGMGLVAVLEAFADAMAGREVRPSPAGAAATAAPRLADSTRVRPREAGSLAYAYEVQYLLEADGGRVAPLREALGRIGDSVAVVGGGSTWKVHVHTNDVGRAIELGIEAGRPSDISVVAFEDQMRAARVPDLGIPVARAETPAAVVAVASGDGARRLFADLGALAVDGGPTMNPSVGEILQAVERAPAESVVVLPNSDNVLPAAMQAAARATKRVHVLPTSDMGQGLAAAVAFGDARSLEDNLADMTDALARVRSGHVAVATRDARTPAGPVRDGQAIGFSGKEAVVIGGDPVEVTLRVASTLVQEGAEVLTILVGASADPAERERLARALADRFPELTVEVRDGGQAAHRYVLSVE